MKQPFSNNLNQPEDQLIQQQHQHKQIELQEVQAPNPYLPQKNNEIPQVQNPQVVMYNPEQDYGLNVDPLSKQNIKFEREKEKFQRDLKDIKVFGVNTYNDTKAAANKKYDELKQANPILQKVEDKGKQVLSKANAIADQIKIEYDKLEEKYKEFMKQQKERLNVWARTKVKIIIMDLIIKSKEDIKEAIKDPYMFMWVEKLVDDIVDDNWPQIEQEILYRLNMIIDEPIVHQVVDPQRCCLVACFYYLPNKYLYERIPFNKSTWYQFRRVWFWFFMLFEIFPFYGVQSFTYFLVFLFIDKSDECGIIGGFIGYIQYYFCQSYGQKNQLDSFDNCTQEGPGVNVNIYADIIGIFLQICLAWFAYVLIPISRSKGKNIEYRYSVTNINQQENKIQDTQTCCCCVIDQSKGGRLRRFMVYDLVIFLILVGAFFGFVFGLKKKQECIPVLPQIITEARKTGYDQYGVCVPKIIKYTNKEWDDIESKYDQSRSSIRIQPNEEEEEKEILNGINVSDLYQ